MVEAILYIAICVLTGLCGRATRVGFAGTFVVALIATPLLVLPVLLLIAPRHRIERIERIERTRHRARRI